MYPQYVRVQLYNIIIICVAVYIYCTNLLAKPWVLLAANIPVCESENERESENAKIIGTFLLLSQAENVPVH